MLKTEFHVSALVLACILAMPGKAGAASSGQSLIDPAQYRGLAADRRAYRVGDVLTVYVLEASRARSQAATDASRDTDVKIDLKAPSTHYDASLGISGKRSGAAQTMRIGELRAQISVRVVAVEPNDLLRIRGAQSLVVNGEQQHIELSGLVRGEDISSDNAVWSNRIADVDVQLTGAGDVSQAQRQSVLARVFRWLGLL